MPRISRCKARRWDSDRARAEHRGCTLELECDSGGAIDRNTETGRWKRSAIGYHRRSARLSDKPDPEETEQRDRRRDSNNACGTNSVLRVLGNRALTSQQTAALSEDEKRAIRERLSRARATSERELRRGALSRIKSVLRAGALACWPATLLGTSQLRTRSSLGRVSLVRVFAARDTNGAPVRIKLRTRMSLRLF